MRLIIGDYSDGKLEPGYHETGDDVPSSVLQELKGRFTAEYRAANIRLTEDQLLAAATPDQDIIQAVHALEQLDVVLNGLGKYTTEWHQLHHPGDPHPWNELSELTVEEPGLRQLNHSVKELNATRDAVLAHIESEMRKALPNTTELVGGIIAAKLLNHAGSIERFSRMPSTTVQLLGAEQALFRFLRAKDGRPPKYGVLFNHPLVQGVHPSRRGKMARQLANAIAISVKVDAHHGAPIGETLKRKVEAQYHAITRS